MIGRTLWIIAHWIAASASLFVGAGIAIGAVFGGFDSDSFAAAVGLAGGVAATLLGAILATVLNSTVEIYSAFMKGTTTSRTVACAWVLVIAGLLLSLIFLRRSAGIGPFGSYGSVLDSPSSAPLIGALGITSLLAELGLGLTEFHAARSIRKTST